MNRSPNRPHRRPAGRVVFLAALIAGLATPAAFPARADDSSSSTPPLGAGGAGTADSPATAPARLEVLVAGPRGEQERLFSIDCAFSEPMVRLGERGGEAKDSPLRFAPPLLGRFAWLGTSTVTFLPERPPAPGTRITCTVPAGTRSLAGRKLAIDYTWTIDYQRPRLVASIPARPLPERPAPRGPLPPTLYADDPVILAFSAPLRTGEAEQIRLLGQDGPVPWRLVPADSLHLRALGSGPQRDEIDPAGVVVGQPLQPLAEGEVYRCEVPGDLAFADRTLGLAAALEWDFRTTPPPGVLSVRVENEQLAFRLASPTEPESLLSYLRLTPRARDLHADGWNENISVWGGLPAGKKLRVEVRPGLPDLFGRRTALPYDATVTMPHAEARLEAYPASGVLLPDEKPFIQIRGENVTPVRIRAAWISSEEIARQFALLAVRYGDRDEEPPSPPPPAGPKPRWIELPRWASPAAHPDSLCTLEYPFDRLLPHPPGAAGLLLEVEARRVFPATNDWQPDTLRQTSLIRTTRVGIHCQLGESSGLLWITDLLTGEPLADAAVSLWSFAPSHPEEVWSGRTDGEGIAWTPGRGTFPAKGIPSLARAVTPAGEAWLDLSTPWRGSSLSRTEGANSAFVCTDRPIYRPEETVRWKAFVRHCDQTGLQSPGPTALRAVLRLSERKITADLATDAEGNCDGSFRLPADGPTGGFSIELGFPLGTDDVEALGSTRASMESFRAPRFEAGVETETPRVVSGGTGVFTGRFAYFSGAPLAGMPIRWFIRRQPGSFHPKGWEDYSFSDDRPGARWDGAWAGPQPMLDGETRLDLDGRTRIEIPLVLPPEAADAILTVEMGARDLADQSSFDRTELQLLRGPWRPAVCAASDEQQLRGQGVWTWAVTDTGGTAVPGISATLEFIRRDWRTVRIRRIGGTFDYDNHAVDSVLVRRDVTSRDRPEQVTAELHGPGLYLVRVTLREPDGSLISAAQSRWFAGDGPANFPREKMDWIQLQTDRRQAAPDDTVSVIIPAPAGGAHALLVVQSGTLLRARSLTVEGTPRVAVPLEGLAPPNVDISAVLVGPDRVPADDRGGPRRSLPYFARGVTSVEIRRDRWQADVEVTPDRKVAVPGEEVGIEIRLTDGSGAPLAGEVTLAVVDEAVLALAGEQPADPTRALFRSRYDRVEMDDIRNQLQLGPLSEKGAETPGGGGGDGDAAAAWLRSRFQATAYWNASIRVGSDGVARVPVRLPDSLTRYRVRAIAACAGQRFGTGDARLRVDRPLNVEAAAPRLLRPGDRWVLGAIVQNRTDRALPVRVRCAAEGARLEGAAQWKGTLKPRTTQRAEFRLRTGDPGPVKITLTAEGEGPEGPVRDGMVRLLESRMEVDRITEVAFGRAAPRAVEGLSLEEPGLVGSGKLSARVTPTILAGLSDAILYLADFPHPCTEQIDSRLLALLERRDLADRLPPDSLGAPEIEAAMVRGIAELAARMRPGAGGFRLWPDSPTRYPYLDGYTLWTLARLQQAGVAVPERLLKHAVNSARSLLDRAQRNPRSKEPDETEQPDPDIPSPGERAFLLWALSEADPSKVRDADIEAATIKAQTLGTAGQLSLLLALDRYAAADSSRPVLRQSAQAQIRRFLELAGSRFDGNARTVSLAEEDPGKFPWFSGPSDRVRPTALAVILLSRANPDHPLLPQCANWLLEERRHGRWANTHENALAMEAVREYVTRLEQMDLPLQGRIRLGLSAEQGFRFDAGALQPQEFSWNLPQLQAVRRPDPRSPDVPLTIEASGRGPIYYELRLDRFRPALTAPAAEEGLVVQREYLSAATGKRLETLRRGEPILTHLALVVPHDARWLVLDDPLPAGCEAVNLRLRTASQFEHLGGPPGPPAAGAPDRSRPRVLRSAAEGAEAEALPAAESGRVLRFDQKDILDDRVRFYADDVPAGVYHLFYPVSATTAGEFGTPGARAALLYEPEVYGTGASATIRIE